LLALPHALENVTVTKSEDLVDVQSPGVKMNEELLNAMTPSEKQWGEMSPRVIQLNETWLSVMRLSVMRLSVMTPSVNQMNGPLLSVNVCHDALTHSNSRYAHHSLL
jgi:hypothetical protein